jgi:hypothetical protein
MTENLPDEDAPRPEVYAAMDELIKSEYSRVKMFLEMADQRGYSDFDKFVMLARHLADICQHQQARIVAMELEAPTRYQVVTQDQLDQIKEDAIYPITKT